MRVKRHDYRQELSPARSRLVRPRRAVWALAAVLILAVVVARVGVAGHPHRQPVSFAAGLRWSPITSSSSFGVPSAVVAGGPGFVSGGTAASGPLWVSTNGLRWHPVTPTGMGNFDLQALAAHRGRVYAAGQSCTPDQDLASGGCNQLAVLSSADGRSWSSAANLPVRPLRTSPIPYGHWPDVSAIAAGPKGLVAVGYQPGGGPAFSNLRLRLPRPLAWYSADGTTWKPAALPAGEPGGGQLDSVVAVPGGGYLALEGATTSTDEIRTLDGVVEAAGYHGMLFSPDGRRWRTVTAPRAPDRARGITVSLLYADGNRVLAVGVDAEAAVVSQRSYTQAVRRAVAEYPHPIVWQRTSAGGWSRLTAIATTVPGEIKVAPPGWAGVEAIARLGGKLVAVGHVRSGSSVDCAVWASGDGGATWGTAVHDGQFAGACGDFPLVSLAVRDGTVVVVGGTMGGWRAVRATAS